MENTIFLTLLASLGISLISGILGCFIIWRKMAYFGDSLSHSALLGIALGVFFNFQNDFAIIIVAFIFAILLFLLQKRNILPTDSLLGILAHGSLAIAMVLIGFTKNPSIDLESMLFGDISLVNLNQIYIIFGALFTTSTIIYLNWQKLILYSISKNLAIIKGANHNLLQILFISLIALIVAISVKIVGALLITSMLIIPAASARQVSSCVKQMIFLSIFFAILSSTSGILISHNLNILTGPAIILSSIIIFIATILLTENQYR